MANIYIRLPLSRCQYYRNRDPKHPLRPHEPVRFSEYTEEHLILRSSIFNAVLSTQCDNRSFTQAEWKNMMRGRDPKGKTLIIQRDPSEWLTYSEIIQLTGTKPSDKTDLFDYLCIRLPTEVYCIDDVRPVTPTWNIDREGYNRLITFINNDFKRSLIDWAISTFDYCTSNGRILLRGQSAMLERYLIRYNIEPTQVEKDNLRRVIDRWFRKERCYYSSYSTFDMQYRDSREKEAKVDGVEWV